MDKIDEQMAFEFAEIICVMLPYVNSIAAAEKLHRGGISLSAEQVRDKRMAAARREAKVKELSGFAVERLAQLVLRCPDGLIECIQYGFTESARETLGLRDRPEGSDDPTD